MKKLIALCMLLAAVCFIGCKETVVEVDDGSAKIDSLELINKMKDAQINDLLATFNEIEEGLRLISETEDQVTILKNSEGTVKTDEIKTYMQTISDQMKLNRELMAKLQQQLRESTVKAEQLRLAIDALTQRLETKEQEMQALRDELQKKDIHIAELDAVIKTLNSNVADLKEDNTKKDQTISTQDKTLNTAWYVFGTKKELREQKIIDGDQILSAKFNQDYFTKIDIRVDKEIKLYSKYAKILSSHPAASYALSIDANKQYVLRIKQPELFWSTSKYLVILVK